MDKEKPLEPIDERLIIGYYPIRGKAQICRLLCEYLRMPYRDLLFTPNTWMEFKNTYNLNWTFEELPFIKDGEITVIEMYPMCLYLLHKFGRKDLLGLDLNQEIHTDMLLCDAEVVSYTYTSLVNHREPTTEIQLEALDKLWSKGLRNKLTKMEAESQEYFYYGNISLVDFYIYETFYTLLWLCPDYLNDFPKLFSIFTSVGSLPPIKEYEQSEKSIKEVCPINFSLQWKEKVRQRGKTL